VLLSLADDFRCPADHEESPLVLSVDAWRGARVERGVLGCPVCKARYPIANAVVDFRADRAHADVAVADDRPMPDESARVQALLNLSEPGGVLLLSGRYTALGATLADQLDLICLLIGASSTNEHCVGLMLGDRVPLATGSLRGAAIDDAASHSALVLEVTRTIRSGGRLLTSLGAEPPDGLRVLARGDGEWVGEVEGRPAVISLRRREPS
jgi:uncharacterized protein YbaR (Trm112 family)